MSLRRDSFRSPAANRGVGLIEVLIAVLVMAVGALGIAALQVTALRNSQSALERSQAVVQAYAILDAMRANPTQARGFDYNKTCAGSPAGGGLAAEDVKQWNDSLQITMGSAACGSIDCKAAATGGVARECEVTVQWDDSRGTDGQAAQTVSTKTRI